MVIPLLLAVVYTGLIAARWSGHQGGFTSLGAVGELFADPWLLLAGWVHYLAFDLFIGAWEVRDAARARVPHWLVVPCLIATFLVGPMGLLLYFAWPGAAATSPPGPAAMPAPPAPPPSRPEIWRERSAGPTMAAYLG